MQHHVIYVPGILDDKYKFQSTVVKFWRLYGVRGHCHEIPWTSERWEPRLQLLLGRIDKYKAQGHKVSLIGASAGASGVLNAYVDRRDSISGLVYIAGKINAPETVGDRLYAANPAFKESLESLQVNLQKLTAADKRKMHSFYSPADGYVPRAATTIPDVHESLLPPFKHWWAIIYALTFGARRLIQVLR